MMQTFRPLIFSLCAFFFGASFPAQAFRDEDYFEDESEDQQEELASGPPETSYGPKLFDFEETIQDFILETKKLDIPGFPHAFNPSLIRWQGSLLLSFRVYNSTNGTHRIGLVWLDDECTIKSAPMDLHMPFEDPCCFSNKRQDPRLICLNNRLYVVYSNILKTLFADREIRRVLIAELHYDGENFYAEKSHIFLNYDQEIFTRSEKNWVPIVYNEDLYLAYSLNPHRVLKPLFPSEYCKPIASTQANISWNWGVLRGGTPAVLDGDEYIAFFHSSKNLPTVHSEGKTMLHYVMGAYTFKAQPPFEITRMSPEPIVGPGFYHGPAHKTWKPLRVVFPCGLVVEKDLLWLSYGRQDNEVWIAKIDKQKLLNSLVPVTTK